MTNRTVNRTPEAWEGGWVDLESVDFRHLKAFRVVFEERDFTSAGHRLSSNRKSVMRMIRNLEDNFGLRLFEEKSNGELVAGAFATRLFNDLRSLESACEQLRTHIGRIHAKGRLLRVGASAGVFRTFGFRRLFRSLQLKDTIRPSFVQMDADDAGRGLVSGHCDIFVGTWTGPSIRFVTRTVGRIAYYRYRRRNRVGEEVEEVDLAGLVPLDGCVPKLAGGAAGVDIIPVSQWLHQLDHPDSCPSGTVLLAPEVQMEAELWEAEPAMADGPVGVDVNVSYLRHHAYEFLPSMVSSLKLGNSK